MPLYEYECQQCGRQFEALVRGTAKPACPSCQGTDLTRLLSVFAVGGNGAAASGASPCDTCAEPRRGSGGCCPMH